MKPVIGITVDATRQPGDDRTGGGLSLNWNYAQAIADAGGIPILIPPMADMSAIAPLLHGVLIPGGLDIDAARFGEENHPAVELQDPARFEGEARLMAELGAAVPVFGICYGCQFINVIRGGSLTQHLPDVTDMLHTGGQLQRYTIADSTHIDEQQIDGKSYHHQSIKELGQNLKVIATAEDGTIEAVEATDRPWMLGVQWHPERTFGDAPTRRLFENFIAAARRYAEGKVAASAR